MSVARKITDLREAVGGRRFIMALGAGIVTTLLRVHGDIDQFVYKELIIWTVGLYIAGNGAQKFFEAQSMRTNAQQPNK